MNRRVSLTLSLVIVLGVVAMVLWPRASTAPTNTNTNKNGSSVTNTTPVTNSSVSGGVQFSTTDEPDSLASFTFRTTLPKGWISQFDQENTMIVFSPLSAGQADSGDVAVAVTRLTGATWPSGSGGTATAMTIDRHAAKEWSGMTVTAAWHDRFDGWHRGEPMRQLDLQVASGKKGVYYRLTGGPGVSDTEWRTIRDHLVVSL